MAKTEDKALVTKKPRELTSRVEDLEQWMDRFMDDLWRRPLPSLFGWDRWLSHRPFAWRMPAIDVYEEKDTVVVKAELPGMSKDDIEVTLTGDTLTLKGEKKEEHETREGDYYRRERSYGSFARTVELPCEVKQDEIKASFKDGVLDIRLPKTEEAKKKSIAVKID
ncbi:Hsp20/alpha crystallin family protein [Candidatus Nitrospira inopinata]|jgi:HSP20 family protein|uniref:Heat shock protein, Hsp20 family n=1 Tax=Candidatus Nitrospira inopinata TaxID=1715989 RepID=A0A0S4KQ63_9BACT|nr:Hsp20/alpha crystallin family protein [Candidatus Nitrospira inopinata]CUQ65903.1 Heat shock protein, Hsp20 family [Candidatus Nitrospira inopinata]